MRRVKKSRNGCARCKSKRVKCGEERPDCNRCARLGVKCPGYVQSLRWVTEYEVPDAAGGSPSGTNHPSTGFSSKQSGFSEDPLPHTSPARGAGSSPSSQTVGLPQTSGLLDETNPMCDELWNLQNKGSLSELADLCTSSLSSPAGTAALDDSVLAYGSPDNNTADASSLASDLAEQETQETDRDAYQNFSPSAIVRSYPPPSQRSPQHDFMSIHQPLNNPSWTLVEYYFKEVAALFSSYDSQMNPFRTTVSRLWGSSLAICRTVQSMAAAALVNDFPQLGQVGLRMRNEAIDIVTHESVTDDKSLLALLMLGQTASWHRPNDLGISFFNLLRKHLNAMSSGHASPGKTLCRSNNYRFFEEALIYWEMLLSFVADNDAVTSSAQDQASKGGLGSGESIILQRVPHPWTGIARDTQSMVQEVGRLVRRERKRVRARTFTSQADIIQAQEAIAKAQELEKNLLELAHPSEAEIVSPGDDDTPVWHLLTMAEVYRCTGLMQLYRTFPDLLRHRLPFRRRSHINDNNNLNSRPQQRCDCTVFTDPLDSLLFSFLDEDRINNNNCHNENITIDELGYPNIDTNTNHTNQAASPTTTTETEIETETETEFYNNWLTEFTLTTLSRLKAIPLESRTRCLQPFLLVASCSELRLPKPTSKSTMNTTDIHARRSSNTTTPDPGTLNPNINLNINLNPNNPFPEYTNTNTNTDTTNTINIPSYAIEVSRTRKFILGRLTTLLHVLPPKPIHVCLRLVQEVWDRMDRGVDENVYWVDVMIEKGWETTMG